MRNPYEVIGPPNYAAPLVNFSGLASLGQRQQPASQTQPALDHQFGRGLSQWMQGARASNDQTQPTYGDPRGLGPYIRERAAYYGINPDVAMKVAQSEGLSNFVGDRGKSFGAFQLYTGGGLGNEFQRDNPGVDISDPRNERATIDYALRHASRYGWGPWHGAARVGIYGMQGIGEAGPNSPNTTEAGVY